MLTDFNDTELNTSAWTSTVTVQSARSGIKLHGETGSSYNLYIFLSYVWLLKNSRHKKTLESEEVFSFWENDENGHPSNTGGIM